MAPFHCPGRKRLRFPARFVKEPDQHSSTISLWIAHYRPASVMKPCYEGQTAERSLSPFLSWRQAPASTQDFSR